MCVAAEINTFAKYSVNQLVCTTIFAKQNLYSTLRFEYEEAFFQEYCIQFEVDTCF